MLCGYFDDSGSHEQSDHFVVAGYLADAEQWDRFNPLWLEVLARYGLTHMRMADFENRFQKADSEYGVVSRSQRKTLFYQLAAAIRCRVRFAIGGIVPMMGYREHIEGRYETQTGHPYTIATNILLKAIERWAKRYNRTEPIALFFEQGTPHSVEMMRELKMATGLPEWKDQGWLGSVTSIPKGTVQALEAADLIAYELYKEMVGQREGRARRPLLEWAVSRVANCVLTTNDQGMAELVKMRTA